MADTEDARVKQIVAARLFPQAVAPVRVGRYTLLDRLGSGGMGVVYAAHDPSLDRKVAIKLLHRAGADDPGAVLQLQREARAMARVSHPNVVVVHEVGVRDGVVFVAMELVEGVTLERWCQDVAAGSRRWRAIVAMFLQAGRGLAAAHAAGLVHRDFKPANVLVSADGRARVLDFGLARAAATGHDPGASLVAGEGRTTAVAGTPAYMSLEQFEGGEATPASDQFSFCVALYEALVGERPFAGPDVLAALRAGPQPPPPDLAVPPRLLAIVARGLSPDPDARWPTMDALLAALAGVLDPQRLRRRVLAPLLAAAVLGGFAAAVLTLERSEPCTEIAGRVAEVWGPERREAVRAGLLATGKPYAAAVAAQVERALDRYADGWLAAAQANCQATRVDGDQSEAMLDLRTACLERRRAGLAAVTDLLSAGDHEPARALNLVDGLEPLDRCSDREALAAGAPLPSDPAARARAAALEQGLARVRALRNGGRAEEGLTLARGLVDEARALTLGPALAEALLFVSRLEGDLGRADAAAETLEAAARAAAEAGSDELALEIWLAELWQRSVRGVDSGTVEALVRAASLALVRVGAPPRLSALYHSVVAHAYQRQDALDRALTHYDAALALIERHGLGASLALTTRLNRATLLVTRGDDDAGVEADLRALLGDIEATVGPKHPLASAALATLAQLAQLQRRHDEALALLTRVGAFKAAEFGPDHPSTLNTEVRRALVLEELGRRDEAIVVLTDVLAHQRRRHGDRDARVSETLANLSTMLLYQGAAAEAEAAAAEALAIDRALRGEEHPNVAMDRVALAEVLQARGAHEQALAELTQARAIFVATGYPEREYTSELQRLTALAQTGLGRHREARASIEAAHAAALARLGPDDAEVGKLELEVGAAMIAAGEREAGLARAAAGLARVLADRDVAPEWVRVARERMAELQALAARPTRPRGAQ